MDQVDYYRKKASQCRRFAAAMPVLDDPVRVRLLAIADEFDQKAAAAEAQTGDDGQITNRISR